MNRQDAKDAKKHKAEKKLDSYSLSSLLALLAGQVSFPAAWRAAARAVA